MFFITNWFIWSAGQDTGHDSIAKKTCDMFFQITMTLLIGSFGVSVNILAMIVFCTPTAAEKVGDSLRISMFWLSFCDFSTVASKVRRQLAGWLIG